MTVARPLALRRGACPGLSAPLPTGDGLLVRMMPVGAIPLAALAGLCKAARAHGNGVMEVTARGSIQVRGLSAASAIGFAADIATLGIAAADGIPISSNALAGLDPDEVLDASVLAADLRSALTRRALAARLGAKVSVVIDGGCAISLERLSADVRLRAGTADGRIVLHVGVGGDGAGAAQLGAVAVEHGVETAIRLLEIVARHGRNGRARDIVREEGTAEFAAALGDPLLAPAPSRRADDTGRNSEAIGMHPLRDGTFACGVGVAFGHTDARSLECLVEAAGADGANGVRAAAGRALIVTGFATAAPSSFIAAAEQSGFVVRADDPRRHVVTCAGAPVCASGEIASRAIAPLVAATAAPFIDGSFKIHISGCAKGCAHAAPAGLTIVGTRGDCALILNGSVRDAPFTVVPADELPAAIADTMARRAPEAGPGNNND